LVVLAKIRGFGLRTPGPASGSPSANLPALDGVRGIAILWVIMHNLYAIDGPRFPGILGYLVMIGLAAGWMAVTLFFALSGFLITGILLDSQNDPGYYRNFYARRVLRILPLYYGVLLVAFVLLPLLGPLPPRLAADQSHQVWLWACLSNWTAPFGIADKTFPHFWSLAVEEQFYLLWPFLLRRRSAVVVMRLCLGIAVIAFGFRVAMWSFGAPAETLYSFSVSRMDALALGAAAAAAMRVPGLASALLARWQALLALAAVLSAGIALIPHGLWAREPAAQIFGYSLASVSFSLLVLALACADRAGDTSWWSAVWRIAPLRVLAKYSYGMYVFHKPLADAVGAPMMRALGPEAMSSLPYNLAYLGISTLATLAIAMLSYHGAEKYFLRLKPRVAREKSVLVA